MATPQMKRLRILFADDEKTLRELMRLELPRLGHDVVVVDDGRGAIAALEKSTFDAAILDIRMPGMTGIDALKRIAEIAPDLDVVLLTGHATVETAVEAIRYGAFDYLTKPCKMAELEVVLNRIAEKRQLKNKAAALESRLKSVEGPSRLVGTSPPMQRVIDMLAKVAPTDSTVLILGETGTGKEVVARAIHDQSRRAEFPFVPVNCGALPEHLVESELFGHRKGAFTGADQNRKGLFEVADGGTVFLDELGELPKAMQAKLLRFLESREIRRVGDNEPFQVDVRVVCATNRNLREMVASDEFREDLFFRINTFEVRLPALRDRRGDIAALAQHLLVRASRGRVVAESSITSEAMALLTDYHWPGNVRELANVMEHAYILSGGNQIVPDHLPAQVLGPAGATNKGPTIPIIVNDRPLTLHELEMQHIVRTLERNDGNKPETARQLGISLKTLYNKLNALSETPATLAAG